MSEPKLQIRLATSEDAEQIHLGLMEIAEHLDARDRVVSTPGDLRRHGFGAKPAFRALIAEIDGRFAGMCVWFDYFSTWRGRPGGFIQDIAVKKDMRGAGVGEALLRAAARDIAEQGGDFVRLSVDAGNLSAQQFYRRFGLDWMTEERVFAAYGAAFRHLAAHDD